MAEDSDKTTAAKPEKPRAENGAEKEAAEAIAETGSRTAEATEAPPLEPAVEVKAQNIVPGMIVRVHQKIKEMTPKGEERERIQVFEGTVIAKKGKDKQSATITVRKIASGVGVERIFPLRLPTIAKIEVVKQLRVRRAKLYYLRSHKKHLKEKAAPKK